MASAATTGKAPTRYVAKSWPMADAVRGPMEAAEYMHLVPGLSCVKSISGAFGATYAELEAERAEGADHKDQDGYRAARMFCVPPEAGWSLGKASTPPRARGTRIDDALTAIERENPSLKGVLPKYYVRPGLNRSQLGPLVELAARPLAAKLETAHSDAISGTTIRAGSWH